MTHVTYFASSNARWNVEYARRSFYSVFFVYVYVGWKRSKSSFWNVSSIFSNVLIHLSITRTALRE